MTASNLSSTFTDRSNCRRAAKRECGDAFEIERVGSGFAFRRLPETRFPGAAKASAEVTPGLARLRAAADAGAIREATIADQEQEMQAQSERMTVSPAPRITETAPAAKRAPAERKAQNVGKRAAILAAAQAGALPTPPDFSAATHARFRGKLAELTKLAEVKDIESLRAYAINPVSSSPKALDRYRNLCVIALEASVTEKSA
jgi:hypothetical protein